MQRVVVTGAGGFVARELCQRLEETSYEVTRVVRRYESRFTGSNFSVIPDIAGNTNWNSILRDHNCVIHLAARVHVMDETMADSWNEYLQTNVNGTLNLAQQAAAAGVERFIYISSVKVNGENTYGKPFFPEDKPAPVDFYGQSKYEAEKGLKKIEEETGLQVVIIRPPLVYGPEVKANFLRLLKWVQKGLPLPFGAIHNKRSFIYIANLAHFIIKCISHPGAAGETFLVSDGVDLSSPDLIRKMGSYMNRSNLLIPVPVCFLKLTGRALGRRSEFDRLCGSLQVDISKTAQLLKWNPPVSQEAGLEKTVAWFLDDV